MDLSNFIVIEGSDGSGKTTQSKKLYDMFQRIGLSTASLDFPNYETPTGQVVEHMLKGEYGDDPKTLNPYFTTPMYIIDMMATIGNHQLDGVQNTISNRYVESSLIHQGARISDREELIRFWAWMEDYAYKKLALPRASITFFLSVPYEYSRKNVVDRAKKNGTETDINEKEEYLKLVEANVNRLRSVLDWEFIDCIDEKTGEMKTVDEIFNEILNRIVNSENISAETKKAIFNANC